jgi:LuxR family maltose regulon positive regulatory protein
VLLATKLLAPPRRERLVARPDLLKALLSAPSTRLTLVQAPAGSGKTTLLSEWAAGVDADWVSLDPGENDPVQFWSYVVGALQGRAPSVGETALVLLGAPGTSVLRDVLPSLLNDLHALPDPVVLVLDDYHLVSNPEIHEAMGFLLDHLPPTVRIVIATRALPPLPLARLRARGWLHELSVDDLRFTATETAALLNDLLDLGLSERDVTRLHERTEGWAAGLYLAALSLRGRPDASAFIDAFAGDDRQIVDYLSSEVLAGQPDDVRRFLLETSVLDRLYAPLCDAVTGAGGSAARLVSLERANLFVVALDSQRRWYRCHHLFGELLRSELARSDPALVPVLHRRACAWFQERGATDEAVHHATAAGDFPVACGLIAANWNAYLNQGRLSTLTRWLDELPPGVVHADPRLCIARAWVLMDSGRLDEVEPWIGAAEAGLDGGDAETAMLRAVHQFKAGRVRQARDAAAQVLVLEGSARTFPRTVASCILGITRFWLGSQAAAEALEDGADLARATDNQLARAYALGYLGVLRAARGALDEAERLGRTALGLSDDPAFGEHFVIMFSHLALAAVAEARGRLDDADRAAARAVELSRRGAGRVEMAFALLVRDRLLRRLGDTAAAAALKAEAADLIARCSDCGTLAAMRVPAPPPRPQTLPRGVELSDRERAVLRLMATGLSRREIADQLYVSLNTIKTHMRGIYRKLQASTRDEVVKAAADRGLL